MKRFPLWFVTWLSVGGIAVANPATQPADVPSAAVGVLQDQTSPEFQTVVEGARQYVAAYNAGDAAKVAGFYAPDVDYIDQDGDRTQGRDQLRQRLAEAFADDPGAKLELKVEELRRIAPDVLVETGTATVTPVGDTAESTRYVALHVRNGDRWEIAQLTETPAPPLPAYDALQPLDWLVGTWQDKAGDQTVETTIGWAGSKNFLTRNFKVTDAGGAEVQGWEIIGWDAGLQQVRSWIYDGNGGFGEAAWVPRGTGWLIQAVNVLPDGSRATVEHVLTKVSDDQFTWTSQNRTLNGEPEPSLDPVEVNRAPKTP